MNFIFSLRFLIAIFIIFIIPIKTRSEPITLKKAESAYQSGNYHDAIDIWQKLTEQELNREKLAAIYNNIASVSWQLGESGKAVRAWNQSVNIYRRYIKKNSNFPKLLAATLIDLATAYNDLGQPVFSQPLLEDAIILTNDKSEINYLKPFAYFALANSYTIEGNYPEAISAYSSSLEYIKQFPHEEHQQAALAVFTHKNLSRAYSQQAIIAEQQALSAQEFGLDTVEQLQQQALSAEQLGLNTAEQLQQQAVRYRQLALDSAKTAVTLAENKSSSLVRAEVLLQLARLSPDNAQSLRQAQELLRNLPNSHAKVYALLDLAKQLNHDSLTILMEAVESAEKLNNQRIASFAYGEVGYYYELKRRYAEAKSWTHKARAAAETAIAPDSAYRWHWQMDRILIQTEAPIAAIESYRSAIASLQAIRGDLIQFSRSRTFNFQEKIEPVYRELLQLLLSQNTEDNIDEVLKIRDLLQLSELENFFQIDEPTATLGMSGVVVRAGVNSVLGSLWSIKDRSIVSLISEFYHHWTKLDSSKPESLPGSPHLIWYKMYLTKVILYDLFLKSNIVSLI